MRYLFTTLFCALGMISMAQESSTYRFAFYNLENLFHPSDDSLTRDEEFTPEGDRNWSFYRYYEKLNRMSKAILAIGEWAPPALVGVAEIEEEQVLADLIASPTLRKFNYQYVHYPSPDRRGIDVALIYRKEQLKLIYSEAIPVKISQQPNFRTRDILYAQFLLNADTLNFYINHWPSRYGGQAKSEPKRIAAAQTLRKHIDSLFNQDPNSTVVVMGDFNDEPENISLTEHLVPGKDTTTSLINLMSNLDPNSGSHRYKGVWSYLDQILISANLLNDKSPTLADRQALVADHEFLLETDEKYPGMKPFRSFLGFRYHGGFSDHLPVYIDLYSQP